MRKIRILTSLVAGGASTCLLSAAGPREVSGMMPNMVLVFIDDTGWGTFAPNIVDFTEADMNRAFIANYNPDYSYAECVEAARQAMPNRKISGSCLRSCRKTGM